MTLKERLALAQNLSKIKEKINLYAFDCSIPSEAIPHLDKAVLALIEAIEAVKKGA